MGAGHRSFDVDAEAHAAAGVAHDPDHESLLKMC